jgi:hypothetical protein
MNARCPGCKQPLSIDPQYAGTRVECPHCATGFTAGARPTSTSRPVAPPPGPDEAPEPGRAGKAVSTVVWLVVLAYVCVTLAGFFLMHLQLSAGEAAVGVLTRDNDRWRWVAPALAAVLPLAVFAHAVDRVCSRR